MVLLRIAFLSILIFSSGLSEAQWSVNGRRVSGPVKWWAVKHLFVAHKAKCLTREAIAQTRIIEQSGVLDKDKAGGRLDAFRHSYWMALLTQNIRPWKVTRLGIAYEKGNYLDFLKGRREDGMLPDKMSCAMDLYNNQVGINTGFMYPDIGREALRDTVIELINKGAMVIINKNGNGEFLDCDHNRIDMEKHSDAWDIPKCLVRSNSR